MKVKVRVMTALIAVLLLLSSCGKSTTADVNLSDVLAEISDSVQLPNELTKMTMSELTGLYGIESDEIVQFAGYYTDVGTLADEIVLIEAKDSAAADTVRQKVEDRYDAKLAEMKDYLPDEYEKIQNGTVLVQGSYIALIVSDNADTVQDIYKAAIKG